MSKKWMHFLFLNVIIMLRLIISPIESQAFPKKIDATVELSCYSVFGSKIAELDVLKLHKNFWQL